MIHSFGGDARKLLEIIFLIEGIGILTRISESKFVFSGLKGFIIKFNEYIERKIAEQAGKDKEKLLAEQAQANLNANNPEDLDQPNTNAAGANPNNSSSKEQANKNPYEQTNAWSSMANSNQPTSNVFDEIMLGDKPVNLSPYILLSVFVSELIFTILLDVNKCISKTLVDALFEKKIGNHKDVSGFKNWMDVDVSKILIALNLIDTSENSQVIHWFGPDFINLPGVNWELMHTIKNLPEV